MDCGGRGSRTLDLLTIHSATSWCYTHAHCAAASEGSSAGRRQVGISGSSCWQRAGGSWRTVRQDTKAAQQRPPPLHWKECQHGLLKALLPQGRKPAFSCPCWESYLAGTHQRFPSSWQQSPRPHQASVALRDTN